MTIVNESDHDVNPVVQCASFARGRAALGQHVFDSTSCAMDLRPTMHWGGGGEYEAMKSQLLEKVDSTPLRVPVGSQRKEGMHGGAAERE